jgi:hypothetical protein
MRWIGAQIDGYLNVTSGLSIPYSIIDLLRVCERNIQRLSFIYELARLAKGPETETSRQDVLRVVDEARLFALSELRPLEAADAEAVLSAAFTHGGTDWIRER